MKICFGQEKIIYFTFFLFFEHNKIVDNEIIAYQKWLEIDAINLEIHVFPIWSHFFKKLFAKFKQYVFRESMCWGQLIDYKHNYKE